MTDLGAADLAARRGAPLSRRVLAATLVVALIAVLVTSIAALQLVRSVNASSTRDSLAAEVQRLANAKPAARSAIITGLSQLNDSNVLVGSITGGGLVTGSAQGIVPPRVIRTVLAGNRVSTRVRRAGVVYLVEARPVAGGGGVAAAEDQQVGQAVTPALISRLAIALAIGFAAAVIAALIATRALSRPLVGLAAVARRMASGERNVRLAPSTIAEVSDVEAALAALDAALVHSEGRQREFLLSISHELRTPLTAIRGYAEALGDGLVGPDRIREVGRTLEAESARLGAFTDDLLALARLEADDFPLAVSEVAVLPILESAQTAWRATAAAGGVEIATAAAERVVLRTDPSRLRQLIDGLVENALRVSPAGSTISLTAQQVPGAVIIEVADGGPGLTEADAGDAFERGRLRDRYRDVRPVGTGLGLSIALRLVTRMGGRISARPGSPAGAVFRIELPA